jgi:hypothetical protein
MPGMGMSHRTMGYLYYLRRFRPIVRRAVFDSIYLLIIIGLDLEFVDVTPNLSLVSTGTYSLQLISPSHSVSPSHRPNLEAECLLCILGGVLWRPKGPPWIRAYHFRSLAAWTFMFYHFIYRIQINRPQISGQRILSLITSLLTI